MAQISTIQVTAPAGPAVKKDQQITIRVNFTGGTVEYSNLRGLKLNTTPAKYATAVSGSGSGVSYIDFRYTVELDVTTGLSDVEVLALEINGGGYLRNTGGGPAVALTPLPATSPTMPLDGTIPSFAYVYHSPEYVKPGDTLKIMVTSNEDCPTLPTATIAGRSCTLISSNGVNHEFTYVVDNADVEDVDLSIVVSGHDFADNFGTTTIAVPAKVDKTAPLAPAKPNRATDISTDGILTFTWGAALDVAYGEDGIDHYEWEMLVDSAPVMSSTFADRNDRTATGVCSFGDGGSDYTFTFHVRSVDRVGRTSAWSPESDPIVVDTRVLVTTISLPGGDTTVNVPFDVDIDFTDVLGAPVAVSLPSITKIAVTNGAKSDVTERDGTDSRYRFTVTPTANGTVVITVNTGASTSASGNVSYKSNTLTVKYDVSRPSCALTGPTGMTNQPLVYTATFNKPVTGFTNADVTATGHSAISVTGQGAIYKITITPAAGRPKVVTVKVNDAAATDDYGNTSRISNMLTTTFDDMAPTVVSISCRDAAGTTFGKGDVITIQVDFSKPVYVNASALPGLTLLLGTAARTAAYKSGNGSQSLVFAYTVTAADPVSAVTNGNLILSATKYIKDRAGNAVSATCTEQLAASDLDVDPAFNPPTPATLGIHHDVAYSLTEQNIVSTLREGVIRSGVGDKDDLKVEIVPAANENWVPSIHKGYAYYQDKELYLFASKKTITRIAYVSMTNVDLAVTGVAGYDNTKIAAYGPIFVSSAGVPYTQVSSTMRVCGGLTSPTQVGETRNYKYSIPGMPVETYRTSMTTPMKKVPTVEAVQDITKYCPIVQLEDVGGIPTVKYYIVASGNSTLYGTYLYDDVNDPFAQHEIAVVDHQMKIRAMYKEVMIDNTYYPRIRVVEDGIYTEIDARPYIQGNVITLPETYSRTGGTGTIKPGMRVGLKYWVNRSWVLSGSILKAKHTDVGPTLTIEYEGSPQDHYNMNQVQVNSPSYVQLNPLYDGVRSGFLYVVDSDTIPAAPSDLRLTAAPSAPMIGTDPNNSQPVRVLAKAEDADGDPVSGVNLLFSSRGEVDFVRGAGNTDTIDVVPQTIDGVNVTAIYVVPAYYLYGQQPPWIHPGDPRGGSPDYTMTFTGGHWVITWNTARRPNTGDKLTFHFAPALGKMESTRFLPASKSTDWKGELVGIWRPALPSRAIIRTYRSNYATAIDDPLYKETYLWQQLYDDLTTAAFSDSQISQKVYLTITEDSKEPGTVVARAYVTDVTGAYPVSASVTFTSLKSRFSTTTGVATNQDGVAENNYHPAGEDIIWASVKLTGGPTLTSNRIYAGGNY